MNLKNLGLALIAKKLTIGVDKTLISLRQKKLFAVILASDASINTKKLLSDKCLHYQTRLISNVASDQLSKSIGKNNIMVIGILSKEFMELILQEDTNANKQK